jgi:hypothetical protein
MQPECQPHFPATANTLPLKSEYVKKFLLQHRFHEKAPECFGRALSVWRTILAAAAF